MQCRAMNMGKGLHAHTQRRRHRHKPTHGLGHGDKHGHWHALGYTDAPIKSQACSGGTLGAWPTLGVLTSLRIWTGINLLQPGVLGCRRLELLALLLAGGRLDSNSLPQILRQGPRDLRGCCAKQHRQPSLHQEPRSCTQSSSGLARDRTLMILNHAMPADSVICQAPHCMPPFGLKLPCVAER